MNGIKFTVTYADGSTYTHELNGESFTASEGDNPIVVYRMDCQSEGNVYACYPVLEENYIQIVCLNPISAGIGDTIELSERSKVTITEGLSEVPGALGNTEYNTVEKIENKLTETIVSIEGYTADQTTLYDIELVISEDGGQTWIPVSAENFPAEGIEVTLPYPEGTNEKEYDFSVVHMFDEAVNGHQPGEIEPPEVTKGDDSITFRLMGTSPVMIGYKKTASSPAHTHSYGNWTDCQDGTHHQRSCSCGDVQKEAHVWDDGKVTKEATKDAEGIKTYSCKTCGATKTESISKLTSNTTSHTSPKTGDAANLALWIVVMLTSLAGLSCAYSAKRKTKTNHQ